MAECARDRDVARMAAFKDISDAQIKAIQAPALVVNGDVDVVRLEHAFELSRTLRRAKLAILPGGHGEYIGEVCSTNKNSKIPVLVTMKYQLPTGHWIYFCAQIKRDKIDSSGGAKNVATVLSQVLMALDHPIFDPDANRKVLVDHIYVISAVQRLTSRRIR